MVSHGYDRLKKLRRIVMLVECFCSLSSSSQKALLVSFLMPEDLFNLEEKNLQQILNVVAAQSPACIVCDQQIFSRLCKWAKISRSLSGRSEGTYDSN